MFGFGKLFRPQQQPLSSADVSAPPKKIGWLNVMTYAELVQYTQTAGLVQQIKTGLRLSAENTDAIATPVLAQIAEFVQLLPASESHHHANPGGLWTHLLEVTHYALRLRDGYKLPIGASPDEQVEHHARWTVAVFLTSLLHDIGKPICDVVVTTDKNQIWNGLAGTLVQMRVPYYKVHFPNTRDYETHQQLPIALFRAIVPQPVTNWLAGDQRAFNALVQYLSGSPNGVLQEIIVKADQESVANNLRFGPRTRFSTARAVPLAERLLSALRRMLQEGGHFPVNRSGAAVFIQRETAYFVSKVLADKVRDYLDKSEVRAEGAAGIPSDNTRIFDTFQEYGLCMPTSTGQSVWRVHVVLNQPQKWEQVFTCLAFPTKLLWGDSPPANLSLSSETGHISIVDTDTDEPKAATVPESDENEHNEVSTALTAASGMQETLLPVEAPAASRIASVSIADLNSLFSLFGMPSSASTTEASSTPTEENTTDSHPQIPSPTLPASEIEEDFLDETMMARTVPPSPPLLDLSMSSKTRTPSPSATASLPSLAPPVPLPNTEPFIEWLAYGIKHRTLETNSASSFIHMVEGYLLLITPKCFQQFAQTQTVIGHIDGKESWEIVQREMQKSGYLAKAQKGSFMHAVQTPASRLFGFLIENPKRFFEILPPDNEQISLVIKPNNLNARDTPND